jgi:hypothetical protein
VNRKRTIKAFTGNFARAFFLTYAPSAVGGLPTFANLVTNGKTAPIAAVRRTSGTDGPAVVVIRRR